MQPIDGHARRLIAAERIERLRADAETPAGGAHSPRVRMGAALIAVGMRLSRGAAAPPAPGRARAARPW
jgi:hypothetical protein